MAKWFKAESEFASGSSGRVTRNARQDNSRTASADNAAQDVAKQQRQANPKSRADKRVLRGGGG